MHQASATAIRLNKPVIPSGIIGIVLFIFTEIMLFAGFISAYFVSRGGAEVWPPWGQPRLPVMATGGISLILLASGFFLILAKKQYNQDGDLRKLKKWFGISILLGACFVSFQGYEWFKLVEFGLTLTSSNYGGLFYVIIGLHAVHVVVGLFFLIKTYVRIEKVHQRRHVNSEFAVVSTFWFFVVALWPILYTVVYVV